MDIYSDVDKTSLILTIVFSFFGLVIGILSYVLASKWWCCDCTETLFSRLAKCCKRSDSSHDTDNKNDRTLCSSVGLVNFASFAQICAKVVLIIGNGIYLGVVGWDQQGSIDILGTNKSTNLEKAGQSFANLVTFVAFVYEIIVIVAFPIYVGFWWVSCWRKQLKTGTNFYNFLEFLRLGDLEFAILFAPFSNVNLFYLGKYWYALLIFRLAFYSITFAAAVITGIRFIFAIGCFVLCECACNSDTIEVRNFKHLILEVGVKMIVISLKLMTCSSALSTYLSLGILVKSFAFRVAYFSFTLLRGVTALFSLSFTAALLRYTVLKEDEKNTNSGMTRFLGWLNEKEPHVHISFAVDMITYGGLLALNFVIVHGIVNSQ